MKELLIMFTMNIRSTSSSRRNCFSWHLGVYKEGEEYFHTQYYYIIAPAWPNIEPQLYNSCIKDIRTYHAEYVGLGKQGKRWSLG